MKQPVVTQPNGGGGHSRRRNQVHDDLPASVVMDFSPPRSRSASPNRQKPKISSQQRLNSRNYHQRDEISSGQQIRELGRDPAQGLR